MDNEPLYLRHNVQVEPLFDHWYAWSHLISPATAARNVTQRHLRIMESYIGAPQIHANAVKNPKLLGGPFIDYGGQRVDDIRALRQRTLTRSRHLVEFSDALDQLDAMLRANAVGFSLQPLYARIPDILRGYVELGYDLSNQATYRIIEPLLYRSPYYDEAAQSAMLSFIHGDDRPFLLSTPRLEGPDLLHLHIPFKDARWDSLFRCKTNAARWSDIVATFAIPSESQPLFRSFFAPHPPAAYQPYCGQGIRWRYFGHACILLETRDVTILADPVLSYAYDSSISRYTYSDLPDSIDYVIITHNHQDHILLETLLQLRHKIKRLIVPRNSFGALQDPSLKLMFNQLGFREVIELGEFEKVDLADGFIMGLPFIGEHSDLAISTKLAHYVQLGRVSLLFAADSCNLEPRLYKHVHNAIGDIDVLFLGMECDGAPLSWLYGPLMSRRIERGMDESRRLNGCNFEQAMSLVEEFSCREVYVYAMGQEPWLNFVMSLKYTPESRPIIESNRLIDACRQRGIVAERLFGEKEMLITGKVVGVDNNLLLSHSR